MAPASSLPCIRNQNGVFAVRMVCRPCNSRPNQPRFNADMLVVLLHALRKSEAYIFFATGASVTGMLRKLLNLALYENTVTGRQAMLESLSAPVQPVHYHHSTQDSWESKLLTLACLSRVSIEQGCLCKPTP